MTLTEIVDRVRVAVNDMLHFADGSGSPPPPGLEKPVAAYAEETVGVCLRGLLLTAPVKLLAQTSLTLDAGCLSRVAVGYLAYARVSLPAGYLRLGEVRLHGWKRPVEEVSDASGYAMQLCDATMSTTATPTAYELAEGGGRALHLFPYKGEGAEPATLFYVKKYDGGLSDDHGTEHYLHDELIEALTYSIAMKVLAFFGKDATGMAALYAKALEEVRTKN